MLVMGIVNATPDSFSDGGAYDPTAPCSGADRRGRRLDRYRWRIDPARLEAGLRRHRTRARGSPLSRRCGRPVSPTSRSTLANPRSPAPPSRPGAAMWNDVGALREPGAKRACADLGCAVVLMHMLGEPMTMQVGPRYDDVVMEVMDYLQALRGSRRGGRDRARAYLGRSGHRLRQDRRAQSRPARQPGPARRPGFPRPARRQPQRVHQNGGALRRDGGRPSRRGPWPSPFTPRGPGSP